MRPTVRFSSLIPDGLAIESTVEAGDAILVTAGATASCARCPLCQVLSRRVHSWYVRHVSDLPCTGRRVRLHLTTRRFRCDEPSCARRIFAERFEDGVLPARARRTTRLEGIVHHLGLALGGRPGASFAKRLMLPVSNDTLLRVVRRQARRPSEPLSVVGVDDWAFRRNHRYGSIVCDLERRRVVALLPDREVATLQAWLAGHPGITTVSRDRGGCYGEAVARALPLAIQVADRWHLMENASAAFLHAVRKSMRTIRAAVGATVIDPELLTCAERLQYEGYLRREDTNTAILMLVKDGLSIKHIVKRTGRSRGLVRQVIRGERTDVFRTRQTSLAAYLPLLDEQWAAGCRNGAELWRRLQAHGFHGSLPVVSEWTTRRRRAETASDQQLQRVPSARTLARLMTTARDHLGTADTVMVAAIEAGVPALIEARGLLDRFHAMVRRKTPYLDGWITDAASSLLASFAAGVSRDKAAITAAITSPWSNGQTEGQITKLKLVKRQMYGRAKLDLLEARLLHVA